MPLKMRPSFSLRKFRYSPGMAEKFLAVSSAAEVSALRDEMNEHDYNVLVYNLVDNAVEDLAVRTTKQDAEELCVEAEGYIHPDSILQAMAEQTESEPDADSRETMTDIVNEVNTSYSEICLLYTSPSPRD